MTRDAVGAVLVVLAIVVARMTVDGQFLLFVKSSLAVPLLLSAAVVGALGVVTMVQDMRGSRATDEVVPDADAAARAAVDGADDDRRRGHDDAGHDDAGHDHAGHDHAGHGPRMGLLLLAPVAVLLVVPAAPLGALAAGNGAANSIAEQPVYPPLPAPTDGAVDLLLTEVIARALYEPSSLDGATLRTDGFVAPIDGRPGAYLLSRFTVGCCAVDASPYQLVVDADGDVPSEDQWVTATLRATGETVEDGDVRLPVFELVGQVPIPVPENPYIY